MPIALPTLTLTAVLLPWLLAQAAPLPPTLVPVSAPEPGCTHSLYVVGFSGNERALAVGQHVRCRSGGPSPHTDTFDLIDLVDAARLRVLGTFRASPVHRSDAAGTPVFLSPAQQAAAHGTWRRALPQASWARTHKAGHFERLRHDFTDALVRLKLDEDSHIDVKARGKGIDVKADAGAPVGYTAIGRLVDGSHIPLGHVRDSAGPKGHAGRVEADFSHRGHLIAITHHGHVGDTLVLTHTPADAPIGSTLVGFLPMLEWDADQVEELYKQLHPNHDGNWEDFIGSVE